MHSFSLQGKSALVVGGGKGIGAGIARTFAEAGAGVALTSRTVANVEAVAAEIQAAGGRAFPCPADVSDFAQLPGVIERTVDELGGLDILVNSAGGSYFWHSFTDTTIEMLEEALRFTVVAPFALAHLAVPHLLERPGASIIHIGSVTVGKSLRGHLMYDTAKAAETQMTKSLAADLGPKIRVNIIHPGITETEALRKVFEATNTTPEMRAAMVQGVRLRRTGTTEDIAAAALYLASPAGSYVTGTELHVSGGSVDESRQQFADL